MAELMLLGRCPDTFMQDVQGMPTFMRGDMYVGKFGLLAVLTWLNLPAFAFTFAFTVPLLFAFLKVLLNSWVHKRSHLIIS